MNMTKVIRGLKALLCALLAALLAAGCAPARYDTPSTNVSPPPLPTTPPAPEAPVGDSAEQWVSRQTLYYVSADGHSLISQSRDVTASAGQSLAEAVMTELLHSTPPPGALEDILPQGTQLLSIEQSMGLLTVNLSLDALNIQAEDEQAVNQRMVGMKAMIVSTLCALPGVSFVSVLFGGRDDGTMMLPSGALTPVEGDLYTHASTLQAESDRFFDPNNEQPQLERSAALYFASSEMKLLLPEVRFIRLESNKTDEIIAALIAELIRGPSSPGGRRVLPDNVRLLDSPAKTVTGNTGNRVVRVAFSSQIADYMDEMAIPPYMLYGSVILTILGFVPEVDGVALYIGDKQVKSILIDATLDSPVEAHVQNGAFLRDDLTGVIGLTSRIYMTNQEGSSLIPQDRTMRLSTLGVPRALLHALIEGPLPEEVHLRPVMPQGIGVNDILGIRMAGEVALVNLSSNFYRCCQTLSATEERNLVYAMVNTLTENPQIKRVRFYVEGAVVDTLTGNIHLRGELMRSPGLINPGVG